MSIISTVTSVANPPAGVWDRILSESSPASIVLILMLMFFCRLVYNKEREASERMAKNEERTLAVTEKAVAFIERASSALAQTSEAISDLHEKVDAIKQSKPNNRRDG